MKDKYIILDLRTMEYMKNEKGSLRIYDSLDEASIVCGMYELENVWILKLIHNHIEPTN